jgi:hypothetical protein
MIDRREFLKAAGVLSATTFLPSGMLAQLTADSTIAIRLQAAATRKTRLAILELQSGLHQLNRSWRITADRDVRGSALTFTLMVEASAAAGEEDYRIEADRRTVSLRGASEQGLLYAVFEFLGRQGMIFGLDGASAPLDTPAALMLPEPGNPWIGSAEFATRGLLPWPDFLNCVSVFNDEDFRAYFAAMLRMRFNLFGLHVYTQNPPLAESYLSFDFAGSGHLASLEDTTSTSWGYTPQRTSTFKMGGAEFFDRETFGSDAVRLAADNWERADRTTAMLRKAMTFAQELGIKTGIGFEPYHNPAEIVNALPPEALSHPGGLIESPVGRDLLECRLADLLERYPTVDYVWLWQDEDANWDSRKKTVTLSVTPFLQAHEFLRRHAPDKRLVLAGWGGVTRHFADMHKRLPEDIIFCSLNDTLGWDPIQEVYGSLGGRERWPVSWLEDDPSMWLAQFRAGHVEQDIRRAKSLGCQGMLGIHWRHRIVDPTATYFARAAWDKALTASENYGFYSRAQASGSRAEKLASIMEDADLHHRLASTFRGEYDSNGFAIIDTLTPDFNEGFNYDTTEPSSKMMESQRAIGSQFTSLTGAATTPFERERIGYLSGFVNLAVTYCDALELAHKIGDVLKRATKVRDSGSADQARSLVLEEAVPFWCQMAPLVRQTMLTFQAIVTTRNDQGQLASMQNKLVRISLERLRLSIKEFTGELPAQVTAAYQAAISPENANPLRLFLPTRPSLLNTGEQVRLFVVLTGAETPQPIHLYARKQGSSAWEATPADHAGRSVYSVPLGPFPTGTGTVEYYAAAKDSVLTAPLGVPQHVYTLSVMER